MKSLFLGILAIIIIGIGGLVYRNVVEYRAQPIACPLDALVCPDGARMERLGSRCTFPVCPPPNVSLPDIGIVFAVPEGFAAAALPDAASVAVYEMPGPTPTEPATIVIRRYAIEEFSTALATIQQTAIGGASGEPVPMTAFSSTVLGAHRFTVVSIERFEAVVAIAYYLARGTDVLRFDAIDRSVVNWTDPYLNTSMLPANAALRNLLMTLEGG